jgi:hypothetical protein
MSYIHPAAVEHHRKRWMRPDAHRFARPGSPEAKPPGYLHPWAAVARAEEAKAAAEQAERDEFERELLALRHELAKIRLDYELRRFQRKYSPDQPRVPAGNSDGGQWTSGGGGQGPSATSQPIWVAAEKPSLGRGTIAVIAAQVAKRMIEAYRSENGLWDLFGRRNGTVTVTTIDGKDIYGSNSTSPTYTPLDDLAARRMRDTLLEKYPDVMDTENIGRKPNDALFHAETTVLLRAARENGGTLAGREIEVHADRNLCISCAEVLPYVGRELGNPTVTFVGPNGLSKTMKNGSWIDQVQP